MRSLRTLRLLRLFRILKLFRYSQAARRFSRALAISKEELFLFFFASLLLIYLFAVGIYYFEHQAQPQRFRTIFDSIWWSVCSITTVGYGDAYPVTAGGRLFTCLMLFVGLGIVAVPSGIIAAALTTVREEEENE